MVPWNAIVFFGAVCNFWPIQKSDDSNISFLQICLSTVVVIHHKYYFLGDNTKFAGRFWKNASIPSLHSIDSRCTARREAVSCINSSFIGRPSTASINDLEAATASGPLSEKQFLRCFSNASRPAMSGTTWCNNPIRFASSALKGSAVRKYLRLCCAPILRIT